MRILVTGGTGLVGSRIVRELARRGETVLVLSRSTKAQDRLPAGAKLLVGDPTIAGAWLDEIAACDAVIHLAGESLTGGRWTTSFKKRILDSRVLSTKLIAEKLVEHPNRADGSPKAFISTSAIGYYGAYRNNATEFVETDFPGTGFLADVCVQWEKATEAAEKAGVRVVHVRVGVVLAAEGGAFPKMLIPFKLFAGGPVGGGRQWLSWIHIDDLVGIFLRTLDRPEAKGPINATAPEPLTNWGFSKTLGQIIGRPSFLPTPAFALRLLMGGMSELATHGQRVIPTRAKALGYEFRYPLLEKALRQILDLEIPDRVST